MRRRIAIAIAVVGVIVVAIRRRDEPTTAVVSRRADVVADVARIAVTPAPLDTVDRKVERTLAADPLAQVIPMLYEQSHEKQLETLYWLRTAPPERIVALMPSLANDVELTMLEKQQYALELVDGFISDLERAGIRAPRF